MTLNRPACQPGSSIEILAIYQIEQGDFAIQRGMQPELREQLVCNSKQSNMLEEVPDDAKTRFPTVNHVNARIDSGDIFYATVHQRAGSLALASVMWSGYREKEAVGIAGHTLGIRTYQGYEGQGHAARLLSTGIEDFRLLNPEEKLIWLSVSDHKKGAQKLYDKAGFEIIDRMNGTIYMAKYF